MEAFGLEGKTKEIFRRVTPDFGLDGVCLRAAADEQEVEPGRPEFPGQPNNVQGSFLGVQTNERSDDDSLFGESKFTPSDPASLDSVRLGNYFWNANTVVHRVNPVLRCAPVHQGPADAVIDGQMPIEFHQLCGGRPVDPTAFMVIKLGQDSEAGKLSFQLQCVVVEVDGAVPGDQDFDLPSPDEMAEDIDACLSG